MLFLSSSTSPPSSTPVSLPRKFPTRLVAESSDEKYEFQQTSDRDKDLSPSLCTPAVQNFRLDHNAGEQKDTDHSGGQEYTESLNYAVMRKLSLVSSSTDRTQSGQTDFDDCRMIHALSLLGRRQKSGTLDTNVVETIQADDEIAASALILLCDGSFGGPTSVSHCQLNAAVRKKKTRRNVVDRSAKRVSKSKNKTITALCCECGLKQTSHFRPVVSDFVGALLDA